MTRPILATLALAALAAGGFAAAAEPSPAELLEKGIYKEETAGDLEAAIRIYEQIIADAAVNRAAAAQAHYRLATCLLKRGDEARAVELFRSLKDKFPEEQELIARAGEQLPGSPRLEPAPWVDGELLLLDVKLATGVPIGAVVLTADSAIVDGREIWKLELRRYVSTLVNNQGVSRVEVDRESFNPIRSSFRHGLLGSTTTAYGDGWAEVTVEGDNGGDPPHRIQCDGQVFDNEQAMHLMRRLPLDVGYKTTLKALPFTGQVLPFTLDVTKKETVTVPAGTFEAYRVELSIGQTFWYSADSNRYLLRFEAGGAVSELVRIGNRGTATPSTLEDPDLGFSLKLPSAWFAVAHPVSGHSDMTVLSLLDPAATATGVIELNKLTAERRSLQEIGQEELEGARARFTGYALREDTWSERQVAGRPVLSFIGDYQEGDASWVQYRAYVLGEKLRAEFIFKLPAEQLDGYRSEIEAFLEGYQER